MQRSSRKPPERTAASTGRRWIRRLQRNHLLFSSPLRRPLAEAGDAQPVDPVARRIVSSAGSRVSAAIIVNRTASAAAIATP